MKITRHVIHITAFTFLLGVFPTVSNAAIIYQQATDANGHINVPFTTTCADAVIIGTLTTDTDTHHTIGGFVYTFVENTNASPSALIIGIATSTDVCTTALASAPRTATTTPSNNYKGGQAVFGNDATLYPNTTYYIYAENGGVTSIKIQTDASDTQMFGYITDSTGAGELNTGISGITSTDPSPDSTVSTTTAYTFHVTGYDQVADYQQGDYVYIRYERQDILSPNLFLSYADYSYPLPSSGAFDFVFPADLSQSGVYIAYASIDHPNFTGIQSLASIVGQSIEWTFTAGTSTEAERTQALLSIATGGLASTTASFTYTVSNCNILSGFNIGGCAKFLLVPDEGSGKEILAMMSTLLQKEPWGFVTRAINLLGGNATSTDTGTFVGTDLPEVHISLADTGFAAASGAQSIDLTPWSKLMGGNSILATATTSHSGLTLRQIMEPGWDFLIAFLCGVGIVVHVLNIPVGQGVENEIQSHRNREIRSRRLAGRRR